MYSRPLPSHLRHQSTSAGGLPSSGQSPVLQARVNEKKLELENLKQLKDLSAGLAGQMGMLAEKLDTLSNGAEAVATVLGNWNNILQAISMASTKLPRPKEVDREDPTPATPALPQTLVRIPTEHAPLLAETTKSIEE